MSKATRPPDQLATIGARLRATREALGFATGDFAASIGAQPNTYSQWESGARMLDALMAIRFADRHNITLDWLYRGNLFQLPHGLALKLIASQAAKPEPKGRGVAK